jgi:uncharacterized protein
MTTALLILAFQTLLGALDNVLHHELTERLPGRPSAHRELALHAGREGIYGVLFLVFAWSEPHGVFAAAVIALLLVEVVITITDFVEEDRTRRLPPFERVLHTILAVSFGAFLAFALPWLLANVAEPTAFVPASHGLLSWFFTLAAIGVIAFAIRDTIAARGLVRKVARANEGIASSSGRTVLVTGATGFIGTALVRRLLARGDRVFVLTRDRRQSHTLLGDHVRHVEDLNVLPAETRIDAVVNLAGAPIIGLPWIRSRRAQIWRSRVDLTERLVAWMNGLDRKPAVLVNGSAIGFYGDRADQILGEGDAAGRGFGADLCRAWEDAAGRARETRLVALRIGIVVDKSGGPVPMMALPVRFGLGAVFGNGRQWMSWITRDDLLRMIVTAIDDERWVGPVNAVAPEPLRHVDFQRALARALHRPMFLQAPSWMLKALLGEMSSIILFSQRVVPAKATALGFSFDVCWAADAFALQFGPPPAALPVEGLRPAVAMAQTAPAKITESETHDDHPIRSRSVPVRAQGARDAGRKRVGL